VLRAIQPHCFCATLPDAGHWAQWEQAAAFEALLARFIEGGA
jgi:pimeloyl-ACP methyl ester carboxylesterase